jgi:hypothetical protein
MLDSRKPDPRWAAHARKADLVSSVQSWDVGAAVPTPVAEVLAIARRLLIDSYSAYEYSLVAVIWALFALEATLKDCTSVPVDGWDGRTFGTLISEASNSGVITQEEAVALRGAALLRNRVVHGHLQPKPPPHSYLPRDAVTMLKAIHEAVSDLYGRARNFA